MIFQPFHDLCPEVAETETRDLTVRYGLRLPAGSYSFMESYCNDLHCDCRRVFFNVYHWQTRQVVAVIAYGWESDAFYAKWMANDDPETIRKLKGPILNPTSPQSRLAPIVLAEINLLIGDPEYIERLKKHYKMFKKAVRQKRSPRK